MNKFVNILLLIILSVIVGYFMREIHVILMWIGNAHHFLLSKLALILPANHWGHALSIILALILVPLILALIPAFIYWIFKRRMIPEYMVIVWVIWFILITILACK